MYNKIKNILRVGDIYTAKELSMILNIPLNSMVETLHNLRDKGQVERITIKDGFLWTIKRKDKEQWH